MNLFDFGVFIGNKISSHKWLKYLWDFETFFGLVIFENTAKGSLSSTKSGVEHMNELFFLVLSS
jgi:hypothetical protein